MALPGEAVFLWALILISSNHTWARDSGCVVQKQVERFEGGPRGAGVLTSRGPGMWAVRDPL